MRPDDRQARALRLCKLSKAIDARDDDGLLFILLVSGEQQRRVEWEHRRIDWNYHLEMLREAGEFQSRCHMGELTPNKLVGMLRGLATQNESQSIRSSGGSDPITPEMACASGSQFLGGSLIKDIPDLFGMSDSPTHRVIGLPLSAVDTHTQT